MQVSLVDNKGFALIDERDWALVKPYRWHLHSEGYAVAYGSDGQSILMHRLIANPVNGQEVDHWNRNRLDNERANLRSATRSQNNGNMRIPSHNTSGFKGARYVPQKGKWRAFIKKDGKQVHLGYFNTADEAAHAYDTAALTIFGEFARPNFGYSFRCPTCGDGTRLRNGGEK